MDYEKLYSRLCEYCKTTDIKYRIKKRNPIDERLKSKKIYFEIHHIIPKHINGSNEESNLVKMLPEEHFMAHLIRYYAYKDKNDFLAVRFMINGYNGKKIRTEKIPKTTLNKMVATFKNNIVFFKSKNKWHSENGVQNISKARKNKMPVIDAKTKEIVGSVDTNHHKIISGEWVHVTKGMISCYDTSTGKKVYISVEEKNKNKNRYVINVGSVQGKLNPRYSHITDEEIIGILIDCNKKMNLPFILPYICIAKQYRQKYNINLPLSFSKFRFGGSGMKEVNRIVSEKLGLKVNSHWYKQPENKKLVQQALKQI